MEVLNSIQEAISKIIRQSIYTFIYKFCVDILFITSTLPDVSFAEIALTLYEIHTSNLYRVELSVFNNL